MADKFNLSPVSQLDPSFTSLPQNKEEKKNDQIGQTEFLQMLVAQLQAQDPLDPMKNEDFSVNLAQFSQLEQLIGINDKLGSEGDAQGGLSSLATYLGHQVVLQADKLQIENHDAGQIDLNLEADASVLKLELLDGVGNVIDSHDLGALQAGKHTVSLTNLNIPSGSFAYQVTATSPSGAVFQPEARIAGIVEGFVPGPEPTLIVNGREVSPSEVLEVKMAGA